MLKVADLSPAIIERIRVYRYDEIGEKHEGPENWDAAFRFRRPEFIDIGGYAVLLPLNAKHRANISILRCIVSQDQRTLTVFLKDTTFVSDPREEMFEAGRLAICEKFEDQDFYLALVYHEWFIVKNGWPEA